MPTPAPTTSSALLSVTWTDWNTDEEFLLSGKKVTAGEAVAYCTGLRMSNAGTGLVTAAIDAGLINAYENIELNNSVSGPRLVWVVNFANELRTEAFDVSRRAIVAPPSQALVVCVK
jgi:hypothetical protein